MAHQIGDKQMGSTKVRSMSAEVPVLVQEASGAVRGYLEVGAGEGAVIRIDAVGSEHLIREALASNKDVLVFVEFREKDTRQ